MLCLQFCVAVVLLVDLFLKLHVGLFEDGVLFLDFIVLRGQLLDELVELVVHISLLLDGVSQLLHLGAELLFLLVSLLVGLGLDVD